MKELFVLSPGYTPSVASTNHLIAYVKGFAENGVHVTLFFLHPSSQRDKYEEKINNVDVVHLWEGIRSGNRYIKRILPLKKFYSLMQPGIPVFVSGGSELMFFLRRKKGIKLYHERTENPDRTKVLFNNLYKRTLRKLDGIVVITPSLRKLFIDDLKIKPERIIVANMVVDENRFTTLRDTPPSHVIGYCGTISEWKDGVSYLIKAFGIVHEKHPEYKLLLMGSFENEETKRKILTNVRELNLQESVTFYGLVKSEDMPQMLKSCEILALSRPKQKEKAFGFATKIGEYLMTERPVVMTDVGDSSYYLKDKEEVIFAKPNDEKDFANKVLWVINNTTESEKIGRRGREAAHRQFNYLTESKKIIDFIYG